MQDIIGFILRSGRCHLRDKSLVELDVIKQAELGI